MLISGTFMTKAYTRSMRRAKSFHENTGTRLPAANSRIAGKFVGIKRRTLQDTKAQFGPCDENKGAIMN
jgi:hypothetical protein